MKKQLRNYIALNILAMTGTSCYVLADTFFISMAQGSNGITALNLVLPVYGLIYALGSMIGVGCATRYSLSKAGSGSGDKDFFSNSIWWTLLCSGIFVLIGIFFPGQLLALLGADGEIMAIGLPYIRIVLCFTPFFMLNYTFTSFARNDNGPKLAMLATLLSGIFNIVFDYIFMFPMQMGMVGAALATAFSPIISMGICMVHYLSKKNTVVWTKTRPSLKKLLSGCRLGVAAFVGELSSGITTLVFNYILLGLAGNVAVAAYGVIANIALVGTGLFNGIALGLQPVASLAHAQGDLGAEKAIYKSARTIGAGIAAGAVAAALVFGDEMISAFNRENSAALAEYAAVGLRIYFAGFLIAAVNIVKSGFYSAIGQAAESSVIALSRGVFTISIMAFLLSRLLGVTGVWLAFPVSEGVTWLISVVFHRIQTRGQARREASG